MHGKDGVARLDYAVLTFTKTDHNQALYPALFAQVAPGERMCMRGFWGKSYNKLFCGEGADRYLVMATSYRAHQFLANNDVRDLDDLSVARLDVQVTLACPDPDSVIRLTKPPRMYKCTMITDLHGEGCTLYVGSPTSRARMRLYNKTAESGLTAEDGRKLLRVEVQLRDNYADFALKSYYGGMLDRLMLSYARKMTDEYVSSLVERELNEKRSVDRVSDEQSEDGGAVERRVAWLHNSVRPALLRLAVMDHRAALDFVSRMLHDLNQIEGSEKSRSCDFEV